MNWESDVKKIKVGVDYLVYFKVEQYMAGTFHRTGKPNEIVFRSSDGAWTATVDEIAKFVEIE